MGAGRPKGGCLKAPGWSLSESCFQGRGITSPDFKYWNQWGYSWVKTENRKNVILIRVHVPTLHASRCVWKHLNTQLKWFLKTRELALRPIISWHFREFSLNSTSCNQSGGLLKVSVNAKYNVGKKTRVSVEFYSCATLPSFHCFFLCGRFCFYLHFHFFALLLVLLQTRLCKCVQVMFPFTFHWSLGRCRTNGSVEAWFTLGWSGQAHLLTKSNEQKVDVGPMVSTKKKKKKTQK